MKKIKFVDVLPERKAFGKNASRFVQIAALLRGKPGSWALLDTKQNLNSARIACSYARKMLGEGFEVALRGCEIYARFKAAP